MIDNRHALERLKYLEDQQANTELDTIEDELPLAFADIFPLSTPNNRRGQSPERKFVVTFGKRKDDDSRLSEEPTIHRTQAEPNLQNGERVLLSYSPRGNRGHRAQSIDSDAGSVGQSTLFQKTQKSVTGTRPIKEQETSRLILDIIPHEKADEIFQSAQNMSRSTLLEVMAEETIDILMRQWTYVDPKYFSEDDRSSIASTEPLSPTRRDEPTHSASEEFTMKHAEELDSPYDVSRRWKSDNMANSRFLKERHGSQTAPLEQISNASSSLPVVRGRKEKKRPSPLIPTYKNPEGDRGAMGKTPSPTQSNQGYQSANGPVTPAPPYPSGQTGQCPSCPAGSPSASQLYAGTHPEKQIDARARDTEEKSPPIDSALKFFEKKSLEILEQLHSKQLQKATQQQEDHDQSIIVEKDVNPVILKDCLGRKFLFPIERCRSWLVSSPNKKQYSIGAELLTDLQSMENLIKSSFSHVGSMSSQVFRGKYDILSPTGEIILPEIWGAVIKPGWVVELRFWDSNGAQEMHQKTLDVNVIDSAPAESNSPTSLRKSHVECSPGVQVATAKRRASLRTWLGSRRSSPSVALG